MLRLFQTIRTMKGRVVLALLLLAFAKIALAEGLTALEPAGISLVNIVGVRELKDPEGKVQIKVFEYDAIEPAANSRVLLIGMASGDEESGKEWNWRSTINFTALKSVQLVSGHRILVKVIQNDAEAPGPAGDYPRKETSFSLSYSFDGSGNLNNILEEK
jgi:hypothetical protein